MESTRPIRALMRGFDALTVLNLRNGATVSEIAHEIGLPRTTSYRILETLCDSGFVSRDPVDDRYRLTQRVKALSRGFVDDSLLIRIATSLLDELGDAIVWPVFLADLAGPTMMLRKTTDHATPLTAERYSAGIRLPLLGSSAGRVYLAFCPPEERDKLLDDMNKKSQKDGAAAGSSRAEMEGLLREIRSQGYATMTRTHRLSEEISVSVPVVGADRVLAAIGVRFLASGVPTPLGIERFVPKLRLCAAKIADGLGRAEVRTGR